MPRKLSSHAANLTKHETRIRINVLKLYMTWTYCSNSSPLWMREKVCGKNHSASHAGDISDGEGSQKVSLAVCFSFQLIFLLDCNFIPIELSGSCVIVWVDALFSVEMFDWALKAFLHLCRCTVAARCGWAGVCLNSWHLKRDNETGSRLPYRWKPQERLCVLRVPTYICIFGHWWSTDT